MHPKQYGAYEIDLQQLDVVRGKSGIYFLIGDIAHQKKGVVYIGKSLNLASRLASHRSKLRWTIDSAFVREVAADQLDCEERQYIRLFQPRLNQQHNGKTSRPGYARMARMKGLKWWKWREGLVGLWFISRTDEGDLSMAGHFLEKLEMGHLVEVVNWLDGGTNKLVIDSSDVINQRWMIFHTAEEMWAEWRWQNERLKSDWGDEG